MTTATTKPSRAQRHDADSPGRTTRRPTDTAASDASTGRTTPPGDGSPTRVNADGIVGIYAARVLDRGGDLRAIAAEARHARFGAPDRLTSPTCVAVRPEAVGRASDTRRPAPRREPSVAARPARQPMASRRPHRRLVAAAVAVLVMLPFAAFVARATESPATVGPAVVVEHAAGSLTQSGAQAPTR